MDRLINFQELRELFGLGRTAAYELTRRPGFPQPVVISSRCYRWPEREVAAFAETLRQEPLQRRRNSHSRAIRRNGQQETERLITGTVRTARGRGRAAR